MTTMTMATPATRTQKILFWVITGLFSAFMIFSSIPDVQSTPEALAFLTHLGYPNYIAPFLGVAKLLGIAAILIPGYPRVKEWAYAGLFFDLAGALYSIIAVDGWQPPMVIMIFPILFLFVSYFLYHKMRAGL